MRCQYAVAELSRTAVPALASSMVERYNRFMRRPMLLLLSLLVSLRLFSQNSPLRCIDPDVTTGTSKAVAVEANAPLIHTTQVFPTILSKDVAQQTEQVLDKLENVLGAGGSDLTNLAKLNIYLTHANALPALRKVLAQRFAQGTKPAATFVVTALPMEGAIVAMDAVASTSADPTPHQPKFSPDTAAHQARFFDVVSEVDVRPTWDAAILPPGRRIYVSGMADTNGLPEATSRTLEKLMAAIGNLGLQKSDVIQLKAFLQPMSRVAAVRKVIVDFFGGKAPPTIFMEWNSPPPNPPIEIELIAAGNSSPTDETESVTFLTPPGTTSTKVFSRIAQVNQGNLIYISGLYGFAAKDAANEVRDIFESLGGVLKMAGSDFEHLVKATYYVSDDLAGDKLNEIRPQFYNPARPPAASKAKVTGVAEQGKTATVEMIAVTK